MAEEKNTDIINTNSGIIIYQNMARKIRISYNF